VRIDTSGCGTELFILVHQGAGASASPTARMYNFPSKLYGLSQAVERSDARASSALGRHAA
jgi:hypothetical protein